MASLFNQRPNGEESHSVFGQPAVECWRFVEIFLFIQRRTGGMSILITQRPLRALFLVFFTFGRRKWSVGPRFFMTLRVLTLAGPSAGLADVPPSIGMWPIV